MNYMHAAVTLMVPKCSLNMVLALEVPQSFQNVSQCSVALFILQEFQFMLKSMLKVEEQHKQAQFMDNPIYRYT